MSPAAIHIAPEGSPTGRWGGEVEGRWSRALTGLIEREGAEVCASNQVIGEAYVAIQHDYGVPKAEARAAVVSVLRSGIVKPLNGADAFSALEAIGG